MTTMDQIHRIRELYYEQDKNLNEIAIIMGCDWRTVRKYVDMEDFSCPPTYTGISRGARIAYFNSLNDVSMPHMPIF